jgi:branched-chain amino acid transport system ATP-binding protein
LVPDALCLRNVHTFYGDSHVLHGVSFSLQPGDVLALLGRNGAGKTTCISTVVGFLTPKQGEIRLFGEPITGFAPERISHLGIGLVPQGRRVFPSLTVRENLIVAQQRESSTTKPWGLDRIYELFPRLRERHAQFAGTLSGGEQQMLAIARTLMGNPVALLLDEPSEGLAPIIVQRITEILHRLRSSGASILIAEQNMHFCLGIASDAIVIDKGQIVYRDTIDGLKANAEIRARYLAI